MKAFSYGEGGLFVDLEIEHDPSRAARTLAAVRAFRERLPQADVVAGGGVFAALGVGTFEDADIAVDAAARAAAAAPEQPRGREIDVPVVYDGDDLEAVAATIRCSPRDVVALHTSQRLTAEIIGFMPGFAYLSGLPEPLHIARRATPRSRVPKGSVAVAAGFSGVYPTASPAGWHLLGRSGVTLFDPWRAQPSLISLGDRVRFVETDVALAPTSAAPPAHPDGSDAIELVRVAALVTVQDGGRAGRCGDGLPVGGAWDPTALAAANLAVGNHVGDAALEIAGGALEARATRPLVVSIDGEDPLTLADGDRLVVPAGDRFVRYLAIGGGVAGQQVLGSRGASPSVGIGRRPFKKGDVVAALASVGLTSRARPRVETPPVCPTLFVDPGPHAARFPEAALDVLVSATWSRSSRGDRVGVRLDGTPLDARGASLSLSVPMVRGALEVPPDGLPIVLGPDHPTTGGYPVIAVMRRASQGVFARLRPSAAFKLAWA